MAVAGSTSSSSVDARDRAPWPAKVGALALLASLLWFGAHEIETWPFTGWRLYSNIKGPTAGSYFPHRVGPGGVEHPIDFTLAPGGYKRAPYLLEKVERYTAAERHALCEAIAEGEELAGRPVAAIRIYWERYRVQIVDGERHKSRIERELRWTCAERGDDA